MKRTLLALGSLLLCSSCQNGRLVLDAGTYQIDPTASKNLNPGLSPAKLRQHDRYRVLVLTSGGADGAFGAGVLVGWSAVGRRPEFDVVSGTSSGALQATAAFLGSEHDRTLKRLYTSTHTRDLLRSNGLKTLFRSGRYDPAPLRKVLQEYITEDVLNEVAREYKAGRRLYVSTTDMTAGRTSIWDMGAIAAGNGERRERYINVLVASAAAPGLIEPVYVKNPQSGSMSVHSDGGVKNPVPLEDFMLERSRLQKSTVWVIANGHVSREAVVRSDAASTVSLAQRGVSQLLRQLLYTSVRNAETKTRNAGADFHLISLPLSAPEAKNPFNFDPNEMENLFATGYKVGLDRFSRTTMPRLRATR